MFRRRVISGVLVIAAACVAYGPDLVAQKAGTPISPDERDLSAAGIATDGASLLDYFQRRTPTNTELASLQQRATQLGSGAYLVRAKATDELIRAGRNALPILRETARKTEGETARRAQYCIGVIEQNTRQGLAVYAARVLTERNPPGTIETLLAYLPFADETWIEDEIRDCLKLVALVDGKASAAIEKALTDAAPKRRAAAAWIVGQSRDPKQRQLANARLADDSSEVRLLAASALVHASEPSAVPVLIQLLTADPPDIGWRAEELLFRLAGENPPAVWLDNARDNNGLKVQSAWENWWKANQSKVDWKSFHAETQALGFTLVVENQRPDGGGRLYEVTKAGEVRWQVKITNPIDAQWLPGGRLLVADSRASQIYEMDTRGTIAWKHPNVSPTSVQRLPNGNTVVSTYSKILELNREGAVVFSYATQGHTYHARKLPDQHYVWIDACGEVSELDATGKLLHKIKLGNGLGWGSVEKLRNGRYLVALGGGVSKVQEIDLNGKVYWERNVNNPNRAVRLVNGHTLVASHGDSCVYEFDAHGKERWKHTCQGRPFAVVRR